MAKSKSKIRSGNSDMIQAYIGQLRRAKKTGMTTGDWMRMYHVADKKVHDMYDEAFDCAMTTLMLIPLNVLYSDYWSKKAKMKVKGTDKTYAEKFVEDCLSLQKSFVEGAVDIQDMEDVLLDLTGMKINSDWLTKKKKEISERNDSNEN